MLETPLYGRFLGENRKLQFAPTGPYFVLLRACLIGGGAAFVFALLCSLVGIELPIGDLWWLCTSLAVTLAGVLGVTSLQMLTLDLKERTYRRRQGGNVFSRLSRGSISEIDALVLIAEPNSRLMAGGVTYHLVLHWKNAKEAPLVVQQETRMLRPGEPLTLGGAVLLQSGVRYAHAMGVPIYDNSHFPSKNPVPVLTR